MGACALTNRTDGVTDRGKRWVEFDVELSDDYDTGGDSVDLDEVGLTVCDAIHVVGAVGAASGSEVRSNVTDPTAPLLLVYTGAATQAVAASDQSGVQVRLRFIGS